MKEQVKYDKRLIDRNIRKGIVSREEYQTRLEALKDLADDAEVIEAALESTYGDKDEEGEESAEEAQ